MSNTCYSIYAVDFQVNWMSRTDPRSVCCVTCWRRPRRPLTVVIIMRAAKCSIALKTARIRSSNVRHECMKFGLSCSQRKTTSTVVGMCNSRPKTLVTWMVAYKILCSYRHFLSMYVSRCIYQQVDVILYIPLDCYRNRCIFTEKLSDLIVNTVCSQIY